MKHKKTPKTTFPLDFFGEDNAWRFAVRAEDKSEVLDALFWRSYLSMRRKEVNLFSSAIDTFSYESYESSPCRRNLCLSRRDDDHKNDGPSR
ncbi:hypothetical protein [Veronia nyctiphanis]|uniref:hypothetical protein n=1 Tax=Veronia nyctiphanis TaxID=1278244 RepID=UPI001F412861|nr:hypothetical protein [Veronia nyctiphanis]